jgi:hypothetical protein
VLVALALACRRDPIPPPTLEIAEPAVVPNGAENITCRVGPKQMTRALDDAGLHLRFATARGNTVSMFGRDVVAGDPADVTLENALARFAEGHAGAEWIDAVAKVASPDGQSATVKVSFHIDRVMTKRLDTARGAAILFPGETATPSANKVAWVHPAKDAPYVLGEGRWRDIDVVALETSTNVIGKACGSVPNGWNQSAILSGHDKSHVELFDRRAGKRIDETTIEGADVCANETDAAKWRTNDDAVRAWALSKLSR